MQPTSRIKEVRPKSTQDNIYSFDYFQLQDGCAEFTFTNQDLYLHQLIYDSHTYTSNFEANFLTDELPHQMKTLHIEASVTENGTKQVETAIDKSVFNFDLYQIKFALDNDFFQPGLPFTGVVKLSNVQETLHNEVIEICYTMAVKRFWNIKQVKPCSNFTVRADNTVLFTILPFKHNVIQINLYVS